MLLKGARLITYGAVLVAFGVLAVLVSVYTPFGKRVLFLFSGLPVLVASRLAGLKAGISVYSATGLLLLLTVRPLSGAGYLLLSGAVPLIVSVPGVAMVSAGAITFLLSLAYLGLGVKFFGLPFNLVLERLAVAAPWLDPRVSVSLAILLLCMLYPLVLRSLSRELAEHWLFKQIFKP